MKKALLWVLAFTAAGAVFAQEIKFDGYFNSGLGIISTDTTVLNGGGPGTKTADTKIVPFGVDSEQPGYRFRLNGSVTNEEGTAGAKFRFQAQSTFAQGAFSFPYAYGWVSFLNKIFTVSGGLVDDSTWSSGGAILDDDVGEGLGVLLKVSPLDGLNLGAGAYLISQQSGGNNNVLIIPGGGNAFGSIDIPLNRLKYTFSAGYTAKDLFKTTLSYRTANQAGNAVSQYPDPNQESFAGRDETSKLIFSAHLLAVKNLTFVVEAEADKLEDTGLDRDKDNIDLNLYETIGYKTGDLAFGLNAIQYFRIEKDVEYDTGLHFNPWVSYTIGAIVPRLDLNYFLAGRALTAPGASPLPGNTYHREVFAYADNGKADDLSVFAIRPSVKFNIDKNTFVEIGDLIALASGPTGAFGDAVNANKDSNFNNVFYVDFKWKF